jgi:hypothetical protein
MEHAEKLETWNNYNNLAETKARKSEKITCICGAVITRGKKAQHEGMKKHKLYILVDAVKNLILHKVKLLL